MPVTPANAKAWVTHPIYNLLAHHVVLNPGCCEATSWAGRTGDRRRQRRDHGSPLATHPTLRMTATDYDQRMVGVAAGAPRKRLPAATCLAGYRSNVRGLSTFTVPPLANAW